MVKDQFAWNGKQNLVLSSIENQQPQLILDWVTQAYIIPMHMKIVTILWKFPSEFG